MGSVEHDTREDDRQQAENERNYEAFKEEAVRSVLEDLMEGKTVGKFDLQDFLSVQDDLPELVRILLVRKNDWGKESPGLAYGNFSIEIERRLRAKLEDSEAVEERAAELA